jgi:hypothetical protein
LNIILFYVVVLICPQNLKMSGLASNATCKRTVSPRRHQNRSHPRYHRMQLGRGNDHPLPKARRIPLFPLLFSPDYLHPEVHPPSSLSENGGETRF